MPSAATQGVLSGETARARGAACPPVVAEIRAAACALARSVPRRAVTAARKCGGEADFEAGDFDLTLEAGRSEIRLRARRDGVGVCVVMVPWRGEWAGYLHEASGISDRDIPAFILDLADRAPGARWIREPSAPPPSGPRP